KRARLAGSGSHAAGTYGVVLKCFGIARDLVGDVERIQHLRNLYAVTGKQPAARIAKIARNMVDDHQQWKTIEPMDRYQQLISGEGQSGILRQERRLLAPQVGA